MTRNELFNAIQRLAWNRWKVDLDEKQVDFCEGQPEGSARLEVPPENLGVGQHLIQGVVVVIHFFWLPETQRLHVCHTCTWRQFSGEICAHAIREEIIINRVAVA